MHPLIDANVRTYNHVRCWYDGRRGFSDCAIGDVVFVKPPNQPRTDDEAMGSLDLVVGTTSDARPGDNRPLTPIDIKEESIVERVMC